MNQFDKIRAALEMFSWDVSQAERLGCAQKSRRSALDEALAALDELERAASEPVAWIIGKPTHGHEIGRYLAWNAGHVPYSVGSAAEPLYAAPPAAIAAAPQFVPAEVTDAAARKVFNAWIDARWRLNEGQDAKYGHAMIAVVREELGPSLGLVAIREPTEEECEQICAEYHGSGFDRELGVRVGRNMFDAVRAAMFPELDGK